MWELQWIGGGQCVCVMYFDWGNDSGLAARNLCVCGDLIGEVQVSGGGWSVVVIEL